MLMRFADPVNIEKAWGNQGARARFCGGWTFTNKFNVQSAFLFGFAQSSNFRIFVQFDMPAQWEPLVQFAMVNNQNLFIVNDKNRNGKIDFFMNVRHVR